MGYACHGESGPTELASFSSSWPPCSHETAKPCPARAQKLLLALCCALPLLGARLVLNERPAVIQLQARQTQEHTVDPVSAPAAQNVPASLQTCMHTTSSSSAEELAWCMHGPRIEHARKPRLGGPSDQLTSILLELASRIGASHSRGHSRRVAYPVQRTSSAQLQLAQHAGAGRSDGQPAVPVSHSPPAVTAARHSRIPGWVRTTLFWKPSGLAHVDALTPRNGVSETPL